MHKKNIKNKKKSSTLCRYPSNKIGLVSAIKHMVKLFDNEIGWTK